MTQLPTSTTQLDAVRSRIQEQPYSMLVDGRLVRAGGNRVMDTHDPSTGAVLTQVPLAREDEVTAAVEAGMRAFPAWNALGISGRRPIIERLGQIVAEHVEELAMLDAINCGNPYREMVKDVTRSLRQFTAWPAIAEMRDGKTVSLDPSNLHFTEHVPYGVVARIAAYNHPAYFAIKALIVPLVMGNAVVLKPADQAPLSALRLGELFAEVLPAGVLAVVSGDGQTGDALVRHPAVKRIGFTGSVATGQRIQSRAADISVKQVSLELGGKNAMAVFPDAPVEAVAEAALRGMNLGVCQGQSCGSTSRIFVHDSIHDELVDAVRGKLENVIVGAAYDNDVTMGPLVSTAQRDKVARFVAGAPEEGARVVFGGADAPAGLAPGYFLPPTLLDSVDQSMRVAREEIFGPVISVLRWHDLDTMLEQVNSVEYGLTGSIWTDDLNWALHTARRMDVGYAWVNEVSTHFWGMPFGGVKASGLGREETEEELFSYAETKAVNVITRPAVVP